MPRDRSTILHVDMDCFFAAVEVRRDPSLAGKALIVGGAGNRGVVASCSYEARAYGVRSAMPSTRARRLCPHAVFVNGHYDLYAEYSRKMHEVFRSYTPIVEGISLDEAFLDVAGAVRLFGPAPHIAGEIRRRIHEEHGLWASVGVAPSKLLAKLASEAAKPTASLKGPQPGRGVVVVEPGSELGFLHPHPVSALWGVGPATRARLERFGVTTIGDLAAVPLEALVAALGVSLGHHLHDLAWARDDRPVVPEAKAKSISHEETYPHDISDRALLDREVVRMGDAVAARVREAGLAGRTVTIKVRFHDFATITRSQTVTTPVTTGPEIVRVAGGLLDAVDVASGVRLLGVGVTNFVEGKQAQLSFDDLRPGSSQAWEDASRAVDEIRKRFGARSLGPAALVEGSGLRVKRRGEQQWGPT
jgi:DNA polymerase-4